MSSESRPLAMGMVGIRGFATVVRNLLQTAPAGRLSAVYAIDAADHPTVVATLREQGVTICESYERLLAEPIEGVWLPVPIDLHAPLTIQALKAGVPVMCEKPAAGAVQDVDAMIAARDAAKLPVGIGYQDVYDPTTVPLKRDLLAGRIGRIHTATIHACWPRNSAYYARTPWAGCISRNGRWILDSPANNALAHQVNIALFLMGQTMEASAQPVAIEAELYRVNPIENFDTCSLRITLDSGAVCLVLMTHASATETGPVVALHGDKGSVSRSRKALEVTCGGQTQFIERKQDARHAIVQTFRDAVRGVENHDLALCTLEMARAQVVALNGASEAAAIHSLPDEAYRVQTLDNGATLRVIPGIESAFEQCVERRQLLHESDLFNWTQPTGRRDLHGYRRFSGPVGAPVPT